MGRALDNHGGISRGGLLTMVVVATVNVYVVLNAALVVRGVVAKGEVAVVASLQVHRVVAMETAVAREVIGKWSNLLLVVNLTGIQRVCELIKYN